MASKSIKSIENFAKRIYRIKYLKYIVVTLLAVVLIGFVDENSVWNHYRNKQTISDLQEQIDRQNALNKKNLMRLRELEKDPKAIEKIARERYFMKADDEDIFVLSDDEKEETPADEGAQ